MEASMEYTQYSGWIFKKKYLWSGFGLFLGGDILSLGQNKWYDKKMFSLFCSQCILGIVKCHLSIGSPSLDKATPEESDGSFKMLSCFRLKF